MGAGRGRIKKVKVPSNVAVRWVRFKNGDIDAMRGWDVEEGKWWRW